MILFWSIELRPEGGAGMFWSERSEFLSLDMEKKLKNFPLTLPNVESSVLGAESRELDSGKELEELPLMTDMRRERFLRSGSKMSSPLPND